MDLQALASRQQAYFDAGHTRPVAFRRAQLQKLTDALHAHEQALTRALEQDLGKAPAESYLSEIGMIYACLLYTSSRIHPDSFPKAIRCGSASPAC